MSDLALSAAEPTSLSSVMSGESVADSFAGLGILSFESHDLDFSESQNPPNPNWVSRSKVITPPSGWQRAEAFVGAWNFDLYPRERPLTYLGVMAGIGLVGSTVQITAYAICRDSNADDPWRGRVTVRVLFMG